MAVPPPELHDVNRMQSRSIDAVSKIDEANRIPVYQINPVMASESKSGIRKLSYDVPAIPTFNVESLNVGIVKVLFENDVKKGLYGIINYALPVIERKMISQEVE